MKYILKYLAFMALPVKKVPDPCSRSTCLWTRTCSLRAPKPRSLLQPRCSSFNSWNLDTDGIKLNVTQTFLQPPGIRNVNVWLVEGPPKTFQGSKNCPFNPKNKHLLLASVLVSSIITYEMVYYIQAMNIFYSVATSGLPGSIIQQSRHSPVEMISAATLSHAYKWED